MSEFYINTGAALGAADEIRDAAKMLNECLEEISMVKNSIGSSLGSASADITSRQSELCNELYDWNVNLTNLGVALHSIVDEYKRVEKSVTEHGGTISYGVCGGLFESTVIDTSKCRDTKGGQVLLETSDEDKESVINDFEKDHIFIKEEFDRFLASGDNNKLTEEDKSNIKYLVYTADEPYRSVFLSCIKKYKISDGDLNDTAYYWSFLFKGLNFDYPENFGSDRKGPYITFFHECGHCIDDLADKSAYWGFDTHSYEFYSEDMGKTVTLYDTIYYDVYYNENNPHSITGIAYNNNYITKGDEEAERALDTVINALVFGADPDGLDYNEQALYRKIMEAHNNSFIGDASYACVSDVYGGVSNNALRNGGWGHDSLYWSLYGKYTPGKELWAQYFSYNMGKDEEALKHLKEFFPESAKLMDDYSNSYIIQSVRRVNV